MGYSHYWKAGEKTSDKKWDKFSKTCKKLHKNLPENTDTAGGYHSDDKLEVAYECDINKKPFFNHNEVRFNGVGDLGHETFVIYRESLQSEFEFCKTARKPYDLLVCACLIAADKYLKLNVSSDGNLEDWKPAFNFYNGVVGAKKIVKLDESFFKR